MATTPLSPSRSFRRMAVLTAVITYLLIVVGGIVRVSGSGEGCGSADGTDSWPLCRGSLIPPADLQTVIEFIHRMLVTLTTVCVAVVMVWALTRYSRIAAVAIGSVVASILILVQIVLGWATVQFKLEGAIVLAHLANAELVLAATILVMVAAMVAPRGGRIRWRQAQSGTMLMAVVAAATFLLILTGANVVAQGAGGACDGWPLCGSAGGVGFTLPQVGPDAVNVLHRIVAGIVVLLIGAAMARVRSRRRDDRTISLTAMMVNVLIVLQILAGALVVEWRLPAFIRGVHLALASAMWFAILLIAFRTRVAYGDAAEAAAHSAAKPTAAVA